MHQMVFEISMIVALCATGLSAAVMLWNGVSVWGIAFRCLIGGGVVFFVTFFGAHLVGRSVLAELAREEMERKKGEEEKRREMLEHGDDTPIPPGFVGFSDTRDSRDGTTKAGDKPAAGGPGSDSQTVEAPAADARNAANETSDADVAKAA